MIVQGYPRMCPNTNDYLESDGYSVQMQLSGAELAVIHKLTVPRSLPGLCLEDGSAVFTCEIRAPFMLYSQRHNLELSESQLNSGEINVCQSVHLPYSAEQRVYFIPAIVLLREKTITLDSGEHGTSPIWDNTKVRFPKGAILAGGNVFQDVQSIVNLLEFQVDHSAADNGVIRSGPSEDDDQWRFIVRVHPDKMAVLQDERYGTWQNVLNVGCFAQMLEAIKRDFKDEKPPHEPLCVLADLIQEETGKSPPWLTEDNEEWDDTLELATLLYKLITPEVE